MEKRGRWTDRETWGLPSTMRLAFTIDALSDSGGRAWRLRSDMAHWRPARFAEDAAAGDALLTEIGRLRPLIGLRLRRSRETGLSVKDRSGPFDFLQRGIFSHAILHRFTPAPIPDKEQMVQTLRRMVPGRAQLLYLDPGAIFRSREAEDLIHNPTIAVRGEIASSPGFIGERAAADGRLVDQLWGQFLAGWSQHLASRRMNCFIPDPEHAPPVAASLAAIEAFRPEPAPCPNR